MGHGRPGPLRRHMPIRLETDFVCSTQNITTLKEYILHAYNKVDS